MTTRTTTLELERDLATIAARTIRAAGYKAELENDQRGPIDADPYPSKVRADPDGIGYLVSLLLRLTRAAQATDGDTHGATLRVLDSLTALAAVDRREAGR